MKSEKAAILSFDIGTSAIKVGYFTVDGLLLGYALREQQLNFPHPGHVEQSPEETRALVIDATREVLSKHSAYQPSAIVISNHRGSAIALDENGRPLSPIIVWMDQRGLPQIDWLHTAVDSHQYYDIAGHPVVSYTGISKNLWFQHQAPEIWEKAAVIAPPQTYFLKWLGSDDLVCDVSTGTYHFPFDIDHQQWSSDLAQQLGFPTNKLPKLVQATDIVGELSQDAARELGLMPGIPLVAGGGDGQCAGAGSGAIEPGRIMINIGTGAGIQAFLPSPLRDPNRTLNCGAHVIPARWEMEGHTQASGAALRWWHDEWAQREQEAANRSGADSYDLLIQTAKQVPPGAEGLLFIPTFNGSSAPVINLNARANLIGLSLRHKRHHVIRAILEGITFEIRSILDAMIETGAAIDTIYLAGGGSKNSYWNQIHADILARPIHVLQISDAAMVGAAMCAGIAVGAYTNWAEITKAFVKTTDIYAPNALNREIYSSVYSEYLHMTKLLASL